MLITQVHIEPDCASESQQQFFRDQRTLLNFLKRWPCLLHTGQARVAPQSSPCELLAPTFTLWRKLEPHIPSPFLPWPTLLPDTHTHHWSQGQWLPHHTSNQRPPGHRVFYWHNMKVADAAWGLLKIILPCIPIIVISQILHVKIVHKVRKPCIETALRHTKHKPFLLINRWQTWYKKKVNRDQFLFSIFQPESWAVLFILTRTFPNWRSVHFCLWTPKFKLFSNISRLANHLCRKKEMCVWTWKAYQKCLFFALNTNGGLVSTSIFFKVFVCLFALWYLNFNCHEKCLFIRHNLYKFIYKIVSVVICGIWEWEGISCESLGYRRRIPGITD